MGYQGNKDILEPKGNQVRRVRLVFPFLENQESQETEVVMVCLDRRVTRALQVYQVPQGTPQLGVEVSLEKKERGVPKETQVLMVYQACLEGMDQKVMHQFSL